MLTVAENMVRVLGGVVFALAWGAGAVGAARAVRHKTRRASGLAARVGAPAAYALLAGPYLFACALLWRPLPWEPGPAGRVALLTVGTVVGFTGAAFYLSGRRTLADMYDVSSALGSELYADHRLVTTGPYAMVRHPMYVGLVLAAVGAFAVYRMWTFVFVLVCLPGAVFKAHREDRLLADEFGEVFETYRRTVPGWMPRHVALQRRR